MHDVPGALSGPAGDPRPGGNRAASGPAGLIARDAERARLKAFLGRVVTGPAALLVRGEPGIGKSALLHAAESDAAELGLTTLRCAPSAVEASLGLAGLADALSPVDRSLLAALPSPQRRALEIALLIEPAGEPADPRALGAAVQGILHVLADEAPVLLVVDDLQWLDAASARALTFALRRLAGERVGLLATTRAAPGAELPIDCGRILGSDLEELRLGPLGVAALFRILRDRLGVELPRPRLVRIHEASGGNPLFALEIGRALADGTLTAEPTAPLPLPASVAALVEHRVDRLGREVRQVLAAAAALARPTRHALAAAFGEAEVAAALLAAADAGVVELDRASVRFVHPLHAAAAYGSEPSHARLAIHRRLAAVVDDPEERARHLALGATGPDEAVAEELERAAARVARRGAPAAAADLADLAVELTPAGAERARVRRTLAAVDLHAVAGSVAAARERAAALAGSLAPGAPRSRALLALAATLDDDLERMERLARQALAAPDLDDALAARLHAQVSEALFRRGLAGAALEPAETGLALARRADDTRTVLRLVAHLAMVEFWAGERRAGLLLGPDGNGELRTWVEIERTAGHGLPFGDSPRAALATRLVHLGDMDEARALLAEILSDAEARGDERSRARALLHLAQLEDYAGDFPRAEELIGDAAELEEQLGLESGAARFARAGHHAVRGDVEETERLVAEGVTRARATGDVPYELLTLGVLGFLRLSLGDAAGAVAVLHPIVERALAISEPRVNRYWPDTIEALVAAGDLERADATFVLYAAEAERLGMPRSLARAAHCRGVLLSAAAREGWAGAFEEALSIHERCPNALEHARTLLAYGVALRRGKQRRAARERIADALARLERLPAPLWADRARAELARTGVRRRGGEGLTETEELVATLAARGLTNREIASRAFLTPKSVEDVLRRVYRQVGVRNKTELAAMRRAGGGTSD